MQTCRDSLNESWALLNHSAFRGFNEADQHVHVISAIGLGFQLFQSLRSIELGSEQELVRMMNLADAFPTEAAAFQANGIHAISMGIAGRDCFRKRQHIFGDGRPTTDKSMCANPNEV